MRIISVNIGSTHIAFDNDMWTGKEYIYANGKLVSEKFSFFGTDHCFEIFEDGEWVEYVLTTGYGWQGIYAQLRRNGEMLIKKGQGNYDLVPIHEPTRSYRPEDLV